MRIVQVSECIWQVENIKGIVIVHDLPLESIFKAEDYIRGYISSFNCYTYEVIPLTKGDSNEPG